MKYNKNYKRNYHPSDPGSATTPQNVNEGLADIVARGGGIVITNLVFT